MRILQIANGVYPEGMAGVEIYTHNLSCALIRRGHDVQVIVPNDQDYSLSGMRSYAVHALPAWKGRHYGEDPPARHCRRAWTEMRRVLDGFRPDIIHVQHLIRLGWPLLERIAATGIPFSLSLADYWLLCSHVQRQCKGSAIQCVRRCQGVSPANPVRFLAACYATRRRKRKLVGLLNRLPCPIYAISDRTAEIFEREGVSRNRLLTTPWGIDFGGFHSGTSTERNAEATLRLGYIGRLSDEKGISLLLEAFSHLDRPATLDVYGGPLMGNSAIEAFRHDERVRFHGPYDNRSTASILGRLDVVVTPSTWEEPYGLVVQEALAAGRSVVVARSGGLPEQILDGVNGYVVAPGSVGALLHRLRSIADGVSARPKSRCFNLRSIEADAARFEDLSEGVMEAWPKLQCGSMFASELQFRDEVPLVSEQLRATTKEVQARLHAELAQPGSTVAKAWNAVHPVTDADVLDFYRHSDSYLFDLLAVHRIPERKAWRRAAIEILARENVRTLFDYGGGCGDDAIAFSAIGIRCTLFDIGEKTRECARRRAEKSRVEIEVLGDIPTDRTFDAVYCTEVLEHVPDPLGLVERVAGLLAPGAILLATHSFSLTGDDYPSHLPQNVPLQRTFVSETESRGFRLEQVVPVPGNQFLIFRRAAGRAQ